MLKSYDVFEEVTKEVVPFGNGSIVYTPKKWIGQTVRVILEGEPLNIREGAIETLQPYLEHVKGVFLHGSFARNEQARDSDVDVLVVADKKFKLKKTGRFDFTVVKERDLRKELKGKNPFYLFTILQESKAILNEELLQELKGIKINKHEFKWMLDESNSALRIVEEFLKLDKLQKRKKLDSVAVIYSMILRLRGFFIVQCVLKNRKFTNKEFKAFLIKKNLSRELVGEFYGIYRAERDDRKTEAKVSVEDTEKLYKITKDELRRMREAYKKCQRKKSSRG